MTSQNPLAYVGINPELQPDFVCADRAPTTNDLRDPGTRWQDDSVDPPIIYQTSGAGVWDAGGNAYATTTTAGIGELGTAAEMTTGTSETLVPPIKVVKDYVDGVAIAGAPAWSESVSGIGQLSTTAEAQAGTNDDTAMTPAKVVDLLETPPAIGGTTPGAGSFTTLGATGVVDFDAGGSWESGGATIDIAADASADAVNLGTGAAARTVTIGNVTGATAIALNSGTGHITLTSTGTGDIILNSDDTLLLDSDGVLELNSSAGVISIGNDDVDQNINLGTDGERVITIGSNNGAAQTDIECGSGGINVGASANAQSITIGNTTGATALAFSCGTGNYVLDGVAGSTYNIGASTTTGTVTIGGTSQTGNFVLGPSDGAMTMAIANSDGAKTINIGAGVDGNTISVGNGINTSAQTVNISGGASAANSTVNVLSGNGTAGTQTCNVLTGNRAGALNLATGAAAHVIAVGSGSAGAVTVDTAAGISLDAATASNFTVTGAADLTLQSTAGSVNILGGEDDPACIFIEADAGTSERIYLHSDQGTGNDSIFVESDAGGVTLTVGKADAAALDFNAASGGCTIDCGLGISLDAAGASNFSTSGAGIDIDIASAAGRVIVTGGEDAADVIYLHADAGTSEVIRLHSDQGTGNDSVHLESDVGGITLTSTGKADAAAIDINSVAGGVDVDAALQVNIASSQAAASAIVLNASDASGGIDITTGGGSVDISSSGFVTMAPATASVAGNGLTINADVGSATFTGQTTAAGAQATFTITNSQVAADSALFVTVTNVGSNDARMTLEQVKPAAGSFEVMTQNNGAAALNGNVIINFWRIA